MSAEWEFLITLNEHLRHLRDPLNVQEVALRMISEHLNVSRVTFAYVDGDEFVISRSFGVAVMPMAGRGPLTRFGKLIIEGCRRGETGVVHDLNADSRFTEEERHWLRDRRIGAFVAVPLIKDGQWLATFSVSYETPRAWTRDQIALLELTAERTWGLAERARAEEALGRTESRQAFLRRLTGTVGTIVDPVQIVEITCRLIGSYLHVNRAVYFQIDGDDAISLGSYVDGLAPLPNRFSWRVLADSRAPEILKGRTLTVNNTETEVHTPDESRALQAAGIGAYISPQLVKDGRRVAAFGIHSRLPRVWTPDEIALVQEVAERTWGTLEHRKAEAELRANEERLGFLLRLNDALRPLSDPAVVQQTAARLLGEHLGTARVHYLELENTEYVIRCEYTHGVPPLAERGSLVTFGGALQGAYSRGETVIVCDVTADPRLTSSERNTLMARQMASFVGVTLIKGGRAIAAFSASHSTPHEWTTSESSLVRDVAERTWEAAERARAEAAVREHEYRLRLALDASAGGSWTWNAITNEVHWDERFRALYGFAPDEPANSTAWMPRVHEDDRAKALALLEEIQTSTAKDSWENTFRIVRPDGTLLWIQSRGRAERDAQGKVIRLTGLDLDFSRHRMAEEALQARRDEAHSHELRLLIETATQGVVMVDAQGTIVMANRALKAMFGWRPGELLGQPLERLLPPSLREIHIGHRMNYLAAPRARLMEGGLRLVGQRKDGSTFPIEVTLNHIPTAAGGRAIAFVTDITERLRAAATLEQRSAELETRTTQLSQMAWDLTLAEHHAREQIARTLHDGLQQLLVIAALNLEQQIKRETEAGIPPDDLLVDAKHQLDEAMNAARSLTFELFPAVLQRSGLPAALTWLAKWTRDKYRLNVEVSVDPAADTTRKDVRTLLFESTRELLFNIVKHSEAGRATVRLELDAEDHICITVADDGIGFDPSGLDERWKSGDVGWGLFSIRDRLALLGGRLDIDSSPGDGSRIRIIAPRRVGARRGAARRVQELIPTTASIALGRDGALAAEDALRILIVDDHEAVRGAMRRALNQLPQLSVVGEASNGYEALAHTRVMRPDVVLMDVLMPLMDGIDATTLVHAEFPEIEILGFSMLAKTETVHAIEQAGASAYFVKGTDTQRLIDYLLDLYASRALRGAHV